MKARKRDGTKWINPHPPNHPTPIHLTIPFSHFYQLNFHVRFCLKKEFFTKKRKQKFENFAIHQTTFRGIKCY